MSRFSTEGYQMHSIDVRETLQKCGCILEGEFFFALKSGRIATKYICIDPLLARPHYLRAIMNMHLKNLPDFSVIAGPAMGAIPLVYNFAEVVGHSFGDSLRTVFAEKCGDDFELNRMDFEKEVYGRNAIVVEDIGSTGDSARKTGAAIMRAGGTIVAYLLIWNRDPVRVNAETMGAPVFSLIEETVESFVAEEHPHWGEWPLVTDKKLGHAYKFPDYPGPRIQLL